MTSASSFPEKRNKQQACCGYPFWVIVRSIMAVCDDEAFRWRDALPAVGVLSVSVLGILFLASQPTPGEAQIAVFVPPWDTTAEAASIIAAAGGTLVDEGGIPNVFIATSDRSDFPKALYRAGAWFVMNPLGAHGCLATSRISGTSL
jgi:hypothetical protein